MLSSVQTVLSVCVSSDGACSQQANSAIAFSSTQQLHSISGRRAERRSARRI